MKSNIPNRAFGSHRSRVAEHASRIFTAPGNRRVSQKGLAIQSGALIDQHRAPCRLRGRKGREAYPRLFFPLTQISSVKFPDIRAGAKRPRRGGFGKRSARAGESQEFHKSFTKAAMAATCASMTGSNQRNRSDLIRSIWVGRSLRHCAISIFNSARTCSISRCNRNSASRT